MIRPIARFDWALDPFQEMHRLQRQMNRWFADVSAPEGQFPAVNLWSSDEQAIVAAEIPGVDPKDVDVSVVGDVLTIEGERKADPGIQAEAYHRRERGTGKFLRSIRLPFEAEADKVEARYEHGVLRIKLPRKESTKPRRVAIAAE